MLCLSRRRCRVIRLLEHEGSLTFLYSLECEPRAVVRVRVRRNVVRIRINETAIRIRVVVSTTNHTAPGTLYLFVLAFAERETWERGYFPMLFLFMILRVDINPDLLASVGG